MLSLFNKLFFYYRYSKIGLYYAKNNYYKYAYPRPQSTLSTYQSLERLLLNYHIQPTNKQVSLFDLANTQSLTYTSVVAKYGKPLFTIKTDKKEFSKVIGYKEKIGDFKIRISFHFFEDELFLYSYKFKTHNSTSSAKITALLEKKYNIKITNGQPFIVKSNDTYIISNNTFDNKIYYLTNRDILEKIIKKEKHNRLVQENNLAVELNMISEKL